MDFCVLLQISKNKISFWYQIGTNPYAPLVINSTNEVPLYFYVDGNDFIFGDTIAIERFFSNDPKAFGNYFEIIKDPSKHFIIAGNKKPVKQLLYHGVEMNLNFFLNQVLYKNDSLESYRQNFPLRFWFEPDIEDKEKTLIESLFNGAGYDNIERIDYYSSLFQSLSSDSVIDKNGAVLLLSGISNTLYLELYVNIYESQCGSSKLEGHGADPSVKILSEMIIEDILAQESYLILNKDNEIEALLSYAAQQLENNSPIIKGFAILLDGKKHYFEVKQRVLNERLLYSSSDGIIFAAISDLISSHSVTPHNVTILLVGKELNTTYLINKLLVRFPKVRGVEKKHNIEALKFVFTKIAQAGYFAKKRVSIFDQSIPIVSNIVEQPRPASLQKASKPPPPPVVEGNSILSKSLINDGDNNYIYKSPTKNVLAPIPPAPNKCVGSSLNNNNLFVPQPPPSVKKMSIQVPPPSPVSQKAIVLPPTPPVSKKPNLPPPPPIFKKTDIVPVLVGDKIKVPPPPIREFKNLKS